MSTTVARHAQVRLELRVIKAFVHRVQKRVGEGLSLPPPAQVPGAGIWPDALYAELAAMEQELERD